MLIVVHNVDCYIYWFNMYYMFFCMVTVMGVTPVENSII